MVLASPTCCIAWDRLSLDYLDLLLDAARDDDAIEAMARQLIDSGVPLTEFDKLHNASVAKADPGDSAWAETVRDRVLFAYDQALQGYRTLKQKYHDELTHQRRAAKSAMVTSDALAISRDNLRTEVSVQQRILEERSAELERLNQKVQAQRDEMASFLYSASHDLKAPLNTITSLLTLFLDDNSDSRIDLTDVEQAVSTAARAGTMLEDLANFSRTLDAEEENETVDLDSVVNDVIRDLSYRNADRSVEFIKDRLPKVIGSEFQLRLLFQNLLSNGMKFCPEERVPRVEILNKGPRGISHVAIAVTDNGIGIDPAHHTRIFGLFARLHSHQAYPGTGIGLSICQRIIRNQKGQIHLKSEPDKGATFTVVLPL